ncbi:hypothetical protein BDB00DRAFT_575481 [Zychaea mexicana]|uniref:uncharacterized protein n=1 Tax=Zychaea mexicana TaxID=64656 RepID=UPI0022FE3325|nr:uncharacterized protein BDB00DRAFT_575481 [Zychaea mexicana]KAI9489962.1 hypothetical protein BDB00DRAFT_575481 [Zychaea mexicana]
MSSSQSNSPPPPPLPTTLSAPNKTLASTKPSRRPSTFSNSPVSPNSPLARSPTSPLTRTLSSDLPDTTTFSQLSPPLHHHYHNNNQQQQQQQQHLQHQHQQPIATTTANSIKQTIASTTSSFLRRPSETLFNPAQTVALKTLASPVPLNPNDPSFWTTLLRTTKFLPTLSPNDTYDLEMATVSLSIELGMT